MHTFNISKQSIENCRGCILYTVYCIGDMDLFEFCYFEYCTVCIIVKINFCWKTFVIFLRKITNFLAECFVFFLYFVTQDTFRVARVHNVTEASFQWRVQWTTKEFSVDNLGVFSENRGFSVDNWGGKFSGQLGVSSQSKAENYYIF